MRKTCFSQEYFFVVDVEETVVDVTFVVFVVEFDGVVEYGVVVLIVVGIGIG